VEVVLGVSAEDYYFVVYFLYNLLSHALLAGVFFLLVQRSDSNVNLEWSDVWISGFNLKRSFLAPRFTPPNNLRLSLSLLTF